MGERLLKLAELAEIFLLSSCRLLLRRCGLKLYIIKITA